MSGVRNFAGDSRDSSIRHSFQYNMIYFLMVVGFTYFYTMVVFQQQKIPENLQRQGAFIPRRAARARTPRSICSGC